MKAFADLLLAAAGSLHLWRDLAIAVLFGLIVFFLYVYVEAVAE